MNKDSYCFSFSKNLYQNLKVKQNITTLRTKNSKYQLIQLKKI